MWPNEWLDEDEDCRRGCMPASNDIADWNGSKINKVKVKFVCITEVLQKLQLVELIVQ